MLRTVLPVVDVVAYVNCCSDWGVGFAQFATTYSWTVGWYVTRLSEDTSYDSHVRRHRCPYRYLRALMPCGKIFRRWPP